MKKTRITAILLSCILITTCIFSGCSKKEVTENGVKLSAPGELPMADEVTELTVFVPKQANIENFETNEFTKWYEEQTNVKIKWEVASGDPTQALNLKLASGDLPDIIYGFGFSKAQQLLYGQQGVFQDISDEIDEHGFYLKKMFEERPDIKEDLLVNGAIYGIPRVEESPYAEYPGCVWVYKPWIEKLGGKLPATTDEFYDFLVKIKNTDLNGNGKNDEIPFAARGVTGTEGLERFLMNSFVSTGEDRISVKDGKVFFAADKEEYRDGLRYMKKLYDEGLLYEDSFVVDRTRLTSIGENETPLLACGTGLWAGMFTIYGAESWRIADYVSLAPLYGPDGFRQSVHKNSDYGGAVVFTVTSACENPALAVKWLDWFFNEENRVKAHNKAGFRPAKEGEIGIDGQQALWTQEPVPANSGTGVTTVQNIAWNNFGAFYKPLETDLRTATLEEGPRKVSENRYEAYMQHKECGADISMADPLMSEEDAALYADYRITIQNIIDTAFVEFVTGVRSLDNDWDDYIKELKNAGLEDYLKLIRKYVEK